MSFKTITPEQFLNFYNEDKVLDNKMILDVREPAEWAYYHLERSVLMPVNTIPDNLAELPKDQTVYVICAHGVRSEMVCRYLNQQGRNNVVNVSGGMSAVAELRGFQYD
jgi:rhodanese-related sulfurtransferase